MLTWSYDPTHGRHEHFQQTLSLILIGKMYFGISDLGVLQMSTPSIRHDPGFESPISIGEHCAALDDVSRRIMNLAYPVDAHSHYM